MGIFKTIHISNRARIILACVACMIFGMSISCVYMASEVKIYKQEVIAEQERSRILLDDIYPRTATDMKKVFPTSSPASDMTDREAYYLTIIETMLAANGQRENDGRLP